MKKLNVVPVGLPVHTIGFCQKSQLVFALSTYSTVTAYSLVRYNFCMMRHSKDALAFEDHDALIIDKEVVIPLTQH